MSDYQCILLERKPQGIVVCTFNRPDVRNALNQEMAREIRQALDLLAADDSVRVLIFFGAGGRAFISGADIGELRERRQADALSRINSGLFRQIEQFPRPTIAAITGYCLGGGCELAMACDLRVAGEGAKFGQPEVGLGILPGAGGTYRLPKLVGLGRAKELIFTGRIIDAAWAERIGLVNQVAPDDDVIAVAEGLASEIAANSPLAVRFAKASLSIGAEMSTDAAMALESTAQAILFEDEEKERRMTAFLQRKRKK